LCNSHDEVEASQRRLATRSLSPGRCRSLGAVGAGCSGSSNASASVALARTLARPQKHQRRVSRANFVSMSATLLVLQMELDR